MVDVLVVGSGASGVNAAAPLVAAGLRVLMLDYGNQDRGYPPLIPPDSFSEIRRSDEEQHRYYLGDDFEGIPLGPARVGAQLTPTAQLHHRGRRAADADRVEQLLRQGEPRARGARFRLGRGRLPFR
ncbi:MAG: hypothetical protein ACR2H9_13865 [Longimicrobiaceae bacterium]